MPINVFNTPVHSILETYCFIFCEAFGSLWSLLNLYLIIFIHNNIIIKIGAKLQE